MKRAGSPLVSCQIGIGSQAEIGRTVSSKLVEKGACPALIIGKTMDSSNRLSTAQKLSPIFLLDFVGDELDGVLLSGICVSYLMHSSGNSKHFLRFFFSNVLAEFDQANVQRIVFR